MGVDYSSKMPSQHSGDISPKTSLHCTNSAVYTHSTHRVMTPPPRVTLQSFSLPKTADYGSISEGVSGATVSDDPVLAEAVPPADVPLRQCTSYLSFDK